ncbi:MAG: glycosyltransferase family 4 protein [bacterium]
MKILMIAPEPIFEPRGTPLSVVGRLKTLSDLGHEVDLLTYSIGEDVVIPGVRIIRIPKLPGINKVKIGPSFKKIPLDFFLLVKTFFYLLKYEYQLIHSHEEAGFWGVFFARIFKLPHIYDMHSSLPQQLKNFQFTHSKLLIKIFSAIESWMLRYSSRVITICPDLYTLVEKILPGKGSVLIENVIDYSMIFGENNVTDRIKSKLNLDNRKVLLYTGTFETYQGLDLLIKSAEIVVSKQKNVLFLLVGGHEYQVNFYKKMVKKAGLENYFIFTGQVPPNQVNSYIRCADMLLSPRTKGTNTPLKIYSYLRSDLPVIATNLLTHTQVLNSDVALLCNPVPDSYAEGIVYLLKHTSQAKKIAMNAEKLAENNYSYQVYKTKLQRVLSEAMERIV